MFCCVALFSVNNNAAIEGKDAVSSEEEPKEVVATKVCGTVKWFNVKSGYGFINRCVTHCQNNLCNVQSSFFLFTYIILAGGGGESLSAVQLTRWLKNVNIVDGKKVKTKQFQLKFQ